MQPMKAAQPGTAIQRAAKIAAMRYRQLMVVAAALLAAALLFTSVNGNDPLEGLEDEAPSKASNIQPPSVTGAEAAEAAARLRRAAEAAGVAPRVDVAAAAAAAATRSSASGSEKLPPLSFPALLYASLGQVELGVVGALAVYAIVYLLGAPINASIAAAWCAAFCRAGGVMERNFSQLALSPRDELMRDSAHCYKFYATGALSQHRRVTRGRQWHRLWIGRWSWCLVVFGSLTRPDLQHSLLPQAAAMSVACWPHSSCAPVRT